MGGDSREEGGREQECVWRREGERESVYGGGRERARVCMEEGGRERECVWRKDQATEKWKKTINTKTKTKPNAHIHVHCVFMRLSYCKATIFSELLNLAKLAMTS